MNRLLLPLLLLLALLTAGCGTRTDTPRAAADGVRTVRIAYLPITHALPLFAEAQAPLADGVRIELIRYGSWPELMDALNTGKVDGASVLIELAVKAREQGIDLKAGALGHLGGNVIIGGNGIERVEDLRGKIFAIPHKQSTHKLLLDQLLAAHGMTEADLTVVEMSPPEMPAGLAQGQIAGYCVAEPFGAKAVALGTGHILAHDEDLWPDGPCCALVFNGDFARANHDLAAAVTQGYARAGAALAAAPTGAEALAKTVFKAPPAVLSLSLQWISYQDLAIRADTYDELTHRMAAAGLLRSLPAYEDFVDPTLLGEDANASAPTNASDTTISQDPAERT